MNSRIQRVGQNQIAGLSTNKDAAGKSRSILKSSVSGLLGKDVRSFDGGPSNNSCWCGAKSNRS